MKVKLFKVWIRSVPGFYGQYNGYVDVIANSSEDAIEKAFKKWFISR